MNLVDSSFWIEYFVDGKNAKFIENVLNQTNELIVPTVVIAEVLKWVLREQNEQNAISALSVMKMGTVIDLTVDIAIKSAISSTKLKLAFADSIIYATAILHNATIYTMDSHFENLPQVVFKPKIK